MISNRYYSISKRSKVVSDKPAYKKKEKTDSGYVYRYDEKHIEKRWKEKREKLKKLEKEIKKVRDQYYKDLESDDERTRAIAAIVGIMDNTAMRVGNEESAEEGTFGATTLKVKHVKMSGGKMKFDFPGKGAIEQHIELDDKKVIKVVKDLMKGKKGDDFIFEVDDKKIWDRAVNRYLQDFDISAKDIRGFHSNRLMKEMLKKKDFKEALDEVAEIVGHEPATLKNQYLDPELVEKNTKKAFVLLAEAPASQGPMLLPDPNVQKEIMSADINANVGNIKDPTITKFPNLYKAWRILAPFLPYGASVSSVYRSPGKQVKIILDTWNSAVWAGRQQRWIKGKGFFNINYSTTLGVSNDFVDQVRLKMRRGRGLTQQEYDLIEKMRAFMVGYRPPVGMKNYPPRPLKIAPVGASLHEQGMAFDVDGASLQQIEDAAKQVQVLFGNIFSRILREPAQANVHFEVTNPVQMPEQNFFSESIYKYRSGQPLARIQTAPTPTLSKKALLPGDKQWLSRLEQKYFGRPISIKQNSSGIKVAPKENTLGIVPGVKVNDLILAAWLSLKPFLPQGAVMTSGLRTPEDQTRIINNYWARSGLEHRYPGVSDPTERSQFLIQNGWTVESPSSSPHLRGNSFDISGADLNEIAEAAKKVSNSPNIPIDFSQILVEDKNNAVHISITNAKYDEQAIAQARSQGLIGVATVDTIFEDLIKSGAPQNIIDEYEEIFFKRADLDVATEPLQIQKDMGMGKDDEPGEYFEKSPEFRNRESVPNYETHDVSEGEAQTLSTNDSEKFFYRGLHRKYPKLEAQALENILKTNAKFYFVFRYHEKPEFEKLLQPAAEALSQQDARAFFYYHLHKKFPELGRGAILQLIDTNPDSFFDLGLNADYPDYIESANNARNIKDPNKVELEMPEWLEPVPGKSLSLRDRNAMSIRQATGLGPIAPMKLRKIEDPAKMLEEYDDGELWIQQKIDGFKTQAIRNKDGIKLFTRRGESFDANVPQLVSELEDKIKAGDFVLGELAYLKDGKQSISDVQTIVGSTPENAKKKLEEKGDLVFYVYDLLWNNGKDITKTPYSDRYNKLKKLIGKGKLIQVVENYEWSDLDKATNDALKAGGEGVVIKPKKSEYKYATKGSNEPIGEWAKHKPKGKKSNTDEVIIKDYEKGKDKLIFPAYQYKDGKLFEVGKLSGLPKEEEAEVRKKIDDGKIVVIEVSFQEKMESGKFRHMGYSRLRPDKPAKEVKISARHSNLSKRAADIIPLHGIGEDIKEQLEKLPGKHFNFPGYMTGKYLVDDDRIVVNWMYVSYPKNRNYAIQVDISVNKPNAYSFNAFVQEDIDDPHLALQLLKDYLDSDDLKQKVEKLINKMFAEKRKQNITLVEKDD